MVVFGYVFSLFVLNPMDGVAQGSIEGTEQWQIVLVDKVMMGFLADSRSRSRSSVTAWMVQDTQEYTAG